MSELDHDDNWTPEDWRKLKAEVEGNVSLRHLRERGVNYEDEEERPLDPSAIGDLQETPVPSPGELASRKATPSPRHDGGMRQRQGAKL